MRQKIWVLTDERVGNSNQSRALAKMLDLPYKEKKLEYKKLILFGYLLRGPLGILEKHSVQSLFEDPPNIIIATGRRAASIALALKKKEPHIKIIQILNPQLNFKHFDLVILPEHDKKPGKTYLGNVIFSYGAVTYFLPSELEEESLKWQSVISKLKSPYLTILIGGNSKKCRFKREHIDEFMNMVMNIAETYKGSLLITSSRRTPDVLVREFRSRLKVHQISHFFYDPKEATENPYKAFLYNANQIIVTGDSISMCSEVCTLQKPVYIYAKEDMISKKHMYFIKNLITLGAAKRLNVQLEDYQVLHADLNQGLIKTVKERLSLWHSG